LWSKAGAPRKHHAKDYRDLPSFMAKLAGYDTVAARTLRFTVLTACRTGESLGMTWDEISFEAGTWSIEGRRMKMGKRHDVPLSDQALAILPAQEVERGQNPHVFPGRPMKPLSAMSMAMLLRRMEVDVTVHGFRSSAPSWMADDAVPFELGESCLAHAVGNAVVQAYQRSSMLERRRPVMQAWASFLTDKAEAAKIVSIGERRKAAKRSPTAP
jgi:integrase